MNKTRHLIFRSALKHNKCVISDLKNARRNYVSSSALLQAAGLRPTRQRLALAKWLFSGRFKHVTAEEYRAAAHKMRAPISLATLYNSLKNFTDAGLLRQIALDNGLVYFDTNTGHHHHVFDEDTRCLSDLPASSVRLVSLPKALSKKALARVNVVVHIKKDKKRRVART